MTGHHKLYHETKWAHRMSSVLPRINIARPSPVERDNILRCNASLAHRASRLASVQPLKTEWISKR